MTWRPSEVYAQSNNVPTTVERNLQSTTNYNTDTNIHSSFNYRHRRQPESHTHVGWRTQQHFYYAQRKCAVWVCVVRAGGAGGVGRWDGVGVCAPSHACCARTRMTYFVETRVRSTHIHRYIGLCARLNCSRNINELQHYTHTHIHTEQQPMLSVLSACVALTGAHRVCCYKESTSLYARGQFKWSIKSSRCYGNIQHKFAFHAVR